MPPLHDAVHLCIDMQRLFAEPTAWHTPAMQGLVPNIARVVEALPGRTIFARFVVPASVGSAPGSWQDYYLHWRSIVDAVASDQGLIDLMQPLAALATDEETVDKPGYSLFSAPGFTERLKAGNAGALIVSGVETDICVLATVLDAVDLGYPVVVLADAVASSSEQSHRAILDILLPRMPQQITVATTAEVLEHIARLARNRPQTEIA